MRRTRTRIISTGRTHRLLINHLYICISVLNNTKENHTENYMNRKNFYKIALGYIILTVLLLCSCDNSFEKEDIIGAWESDELHYVIHLYDNGSCVITNLPRNELAVARNNKDERNDTTRIEVKGTWEIWDTSTRDVFVNIKQYGTPWLLHLRKDFLGRKSKWKLYYSTMDEDEYVEDHTFSRCKN